jgi:3-keto-L-gulonate-6-phosphate decarboxylase
MRQASDASNSAGKATIGSVEKQGTTLGRKSKSETMTESTGENEKDLNARSDSDSLQSSFIYLHKCIDTQDSGYKLLLQKAVKLKKWSVKVRSPEVKTAIVEVLDVIEGLKGSREDVIGAFSTTYHCVLKG